jgi:hypothetical protein
VRLGEDTSRYLLLNTAQGWAEQAKAAWAEILAAAGDDPPATLRETQPYAPAAFARLIQAFDALASAGLAGRPDQELYDLAGLRPIGEVLGG